MCMTTKTVNLSEDAYQRLKSLKREGESFSDVVNRLTGKFALLDLVGTLTEEEAELMREAARDVDRRLSDDLAGSHGGAS